jgi:hypothetical protein
MKARDFRWILLAYCAVLIFSMLLRSDETIGVTSVSSNGQYSYQAGSAPWALGCATVGAVLYLLLLRSKVTWRPQRMPHLFRRWAAGMLDFICALLIPAGFIGFAAVLREYRRTGAFDWLIERQGGQAGDWLFGFASVFLVLFVLMPCYFALPWCQGKPTPGSCVFGFRIVGDDGTRLRFWKAGLRAMLGSMALLAWPLWIFAFWVKRDRRAGKFWLDAVFRTHAEFFS